MIGLNRIFRLDLRYFRLKEFDIFVRINKSHGPNCYRLLTHRQQNFFDQKFIRYHFLAIDLLLLITYLLQLPSLLTILFMFRWEGLNLYRHFQKMSLVLHHTSRIYYFSNVLIVAIPKIYTRFDSHIAQPVSQPILQAYIQILQTQKNNSIIFINPTPQSSSPSAIGIEMQLIQITTFKLPTPQTTKTSYLNNKQKSKTQKQKITCAQFSPLNQTLTCGLNDGSIVQFVNQKFNNKKLTESKEYQVRKFQLGGMHKGEIKCMLVQQIFGQVFVITGSADRTIKIWDTQVKSKAIVQTLSGHTGTIMALAYSKKSDTLFSASVDKTVRVWKQDQGRKFFMYPWYVNYQVISDFSPKKPTETPIYPTTFQLVDGQLNSFTLYLGDSAGNLHIIKQYEILPLSSQSSQPQKTRIGFEILKTNYKHHRLHINSLLYIPKQHLVLSTGFDQYLYGFESLSEKLTLKYANPKKLLFIDMVWISGVLVLVDEGGNFYIMELGSDRGVEEIGGNGAVRAVFAKRGEMFVVGDQSVGVWRVGRGIKTVEGENCHRDAIIGIYALEVYRLTQGRVRDQVKIVSVSLDNTMRVWDPNDLTCLQVMQNPEKAQISSLFYLKRANLFVTGHQNGIVRLWNIQLQTSITISQLNSPYAHKNNVCSFTQYIHIRGNQDITQFMFSTGYQGKVNVWQIFLKKSSVQSSLISSSICPQLKNCFFPQQQQQGEDKIGYQLFALQVLERKDFEDAIILSAGTKGIVYFTKMFTYQTFKKQQLHNDSILCMMIDEYILFTGSSDHTIKLTNLKDISHLQNLRELYAHQSSICHLSILQETGHLISQANDGQILFWNYAAERIVKKIKQKKQRIISLTYVDQSKMMYVGTEGAKILTYDISQLYAQPVNKQYALQGKGKGKKEGEISEEELAMIMKKNQEELERLMKGL